MSRLGEYLKRSGSIDKTGNVLSAKRLSLKFESLTLFIIVVLIIIASAYFLRANRKVYFKGADFEDIALIEQKFSSSLEDYKNFKIDDTFHDFIKASYSGNHSALIEIIGKTQDKKMLGVYHAVYGDPKEAANILSEQYVQKQDPFLLHYLIYSLLKLGNIDEAKRLISKSEVIEGQTLILLASKLEKLEDVAQSQKYYELSLEREIPLELKNSIKIKLSLLKKVKVKNNGYK